MEIVENIPMYLRLLVMGNRGVGKRQWIERALTELRRDSDDHVAVGSWHGHQCVRLKGPQHTTVVDLVNVELLGVGGERYAFIFDITNRFTLTAHIESLTAAVQSGDSDTIGAVLLVGNKCDLVGDHNAASVEETRRVARRLAEEGGFMYVETSATTGEGMAEALYLLLNKECRAPIEVHLDEESDPFWKRIQHVPFL